MNVCTKMREVSILTDIVLFYNIGVIIYDVNWNPSHDEQAQDRSYRIGQERDVEVIRLGKNSFLVIIYCFVKHNQTCLHSTTNSC